MEAIIQTRGLTKTYRSIGAEVRALRGVDLSIARGEFVAIVGPSGCGKSTLLNLLAGLDQPTAGEVVLEGVRVDTLSEAERAVLRRRSIGLVFQFFNLIPNMTVAENVELPALLAGRAGSDARLRREELLAQLGLADMAAVLPNQLSGGQQQRAALARALVNRPAAVLADEPTGNLDSSSAREVIDLLRTAHGDGQTIILVTHDPRVAAVADRVVALRDGRVVDDIGLVATGRPALVLSELFSLEV
jgi:putative ABC transport system ATP-binding protein